MSKAEALHARKARARALTELGRREEALAEIEQAIPLAAGNATETAWLLNRKGDLLAALDRQREALDVWDQAIDAAAAAVGPTGPTGPVGAPGPTGGTGP